jgi:hypothetical protein
MAHEAGMSMRKVEFDPARQTTIEPQKWAAWQRRATDAEKEMIDWFATKAQTASTDEPNPRPEFRESVWTELKSLVIEAVFSGRCAYCECPETIGGFGDAEHYRPKAAVHAHNADGVSKPIEIAGEKHAGYPWLAYDWQNLIPACSKCNTYKANEFPIAGQRCVKPVLGQIKTNELYVTEQPLLLHPYFDEPQDCLAFGERGVIAAKNNHPRGKETIRICHLDREQLETARMNAQTYAWLLVKDKVNEE